MLLLSLDGFIYHLNMFFSNVGWKYDFFFFLCEYQYLKQSSGLVFWFFCGFFFFVCQVNGIVLKFSV